MRLFNKKSFFEYLKGKASDRKGLGMELALLVLLIVFLCSTLLVTIALTNRGTLASREFKNTYDMVLEDAVDKLLAGEKWEDFYQKGKYIVFNLEQSGQSPDNVGGVSNVTYTFTWKNRNAAEAEITVLTVYVKEYNNGLNIEKEIVSWDYHNDWLDRETYSN